MSLRVSKRAIESDVERKVLLRQEVKRRHRRSSIRAYHMYKTANKTVSQ